MPLHSPPGKAVPGSPSAGPAATPPLQPTDTSKDTACPVAAAARAARAGPGPGRAFSPGSGARGGRCVLSRECGEAGYHPSRIPDPCSQSPFLQGQASCVAVPLSGPGRRAGGGGDKTCPAGLPVFSVAPGSSDGSQLTYHLPASSTFSDPSPREELPEGQDGNTKEGHR